MSVVESLRLRSTLLSVEEAAELMGVHKVSLYRLIKARKLAVVRLGPATTRIDPVTLANFIEQRTQ